MGEAAIHRRWVFKQHATAAQEVHAACDLNLSPQGTIQRLILIKCTNPLKCPNSSRVHCWHARPNFKQWQASASPLIWPTPPMLQSFRTCPSTRLHCTLPGLQAWRPLSKKHNRQFLHLRQIHLCTMPRSLHGPHGFYLVKVSIVGEEPSSGCNLQIIAEVLLPDSTCRQGRATSLVVDRMSSSRRWIALLVTPKSWKKNNMWQDGAKRTRTRKEWQLSTWPTTAHKGKRGTQQDPVPFGQCVIGCFHKTGCCKEEPQNGTVSIPHRLKQCDPYHRASCKSWLCISLNLHHFPILTSLIRSLNVRYTLLRLS